MLRCNRLSALTRTNITDLISSPLFSSFLLSSPLVSPVLPPFSLPPFFLSRVSAFSPYPPATPCSHRGESETRRSSYAATPCDARRRTVDTRTAYRAPCAGVLRVSVPTGTHMPTEGYDLHVLTRRRSYIQSMASEPATTTLTLLLPRFEGRCSSLPSPRGTAHPLQNHQ